MQSKVLIKLGCDVDQFTSSLNTLRAFKDNPDKDDIVISDLTMPNMTGDVLADNLIEIRSEIPVIINTGFSDKLSSETVYGIDIGIQTVLQKPMEISPLSKVIHDLLERTG